MTLSTDLTQEFWRAAAIAWGCFVIGIYCFRVAMADPQQASQLVGMVLSRSLILCGMVVLTGFGGHAVQEYRQLANSRGGDSGVLHSVGENVVARDEHVDRYRSPDGLEAEIASYGPAGNFRGASLTAGDSSGFMSAAGGRGGSSWGGRDKGDEHSAGSVGGSAVVSGGSGSGEWSIRDRF